MHDFLGNIFEGTTVVLISPAVKRETLLAQNVRPSSALLLSYALALQQMKHNQPIPSLCRVGDETGQKLVHKDFLLREQFQLVHLVLKQSIIRARPGDNVVSRAHCQFPAKR